MSLPFRFRCTVLFLLCLAARRAPAPRVPQVPEGLFDLGDTVALGLPRLPGAETVSVFRPEGSAMSTTW